VKRREIGEIVSRLDGEALEEARQVAGEALVWAVLGLELGSGRSSDPRAVGSLSECTEQVLRLGNRGAPSYRLGTEHFTHGLLDAEDVRVLGWMAEKVEVYATVGVGMSHVGEQTVYKEASRELYTGQRERAQRVLASIDCPLAGHERPTPPRLRLVR
jgi:hypothetical protein